MKLLDVYSWIFANWLNSGNFSKNRKMSATSLDAQYNLIFSKEYVKQIYRITGIKPDNVDIAFVDYIRSRMFELNPIDVIINISQTPVKIDVTNDKFTRAFHKSSENYYSYSELFNSQSGVALFTGKTYKLPGGARLRLSRDKLETLEMVYNSYKYLFDFISNGGTCSILNIFIELVGKDVKDVKRASDDLYSLLGSLNIGCEVVKSATKAYMLENGPATPTPKVLNKKFLPQLLFTEENQAAFSIYKSRGLVGGGKNAILLGVDLHSRLPFSIDLFNSGAAQIFMLLGKSGSGKSFSAFQIAISALANNHYVSVIDVKGKEWSLLSKLGIKSKIITFDSKNPSFVNTLRLDDISVDSSSSEEYFNNAVNSTVALFMLVLNLQEGECNKTDAELVLREAVMKVYSMKNIDPKIPSSFLDTKDLKYSDVLPILETLITTNTYTLEQQHVLKIARSRLHAYFGSFGLFSESFKNEITLQDVMDSNFVIYELNKNQNSMTDSLDELRIFMIQNLDMRKQTLLKQQGKFLFCFYEELQRSAQFANLLQFICHQVTGSRSNNVVIFLLLNSLKILQSKEGQDIRSNLTSLLVGYTEDNDIDYIENEMNKEWLAHQLRIFSEKQSSYRNCFAAVVDPGDGVVLETVYKVELPDELSSKFRTRTIMGE